METSANTVIYSTKSKNLTSVKDVNVKLDTKFNRKVSSEASEEDIEDVWKKKLCSNPTLFNGSKFRLDSLDDSTDEVLTLNIGLTCYRDFQGTNLSDNALVLQSQGLCEHENSQAYMSDALGVGALIVTADDQVVLLLRSKRCGEDIGMWDRPGGHPEPKVLVGALPFEQMDLSTMSEDAVCQEIFNSIKEELVSEVNIPAANLEEPLLIGIHRSNLNGGKPNMEFLVRCDLSSQKVHALYSQGSQAEAYESDDILFIPLEEALTMHGTRSEVWNKMAPGAKGVLLLYNMYKHRFMS